MLDIACGLNPLSYNFMHQKIKYYCCDLSDEDMTFLSNFFSIENIEGKAFRLDLLKEYEQLTNYKVDVVFAFKAFDSLEEKERNITKKIVENLKAKYLVATFPTKSLGGKKSIQENKRKWFEKQFENFSKFVFTNEVVYVCCLNE